MRKSLQLLFMPVTIQVMVLLLSTISISLSSSNQIEDTLYSTNPLGISVTTNSTIVMTMQLETDVVLHLIATGIINTNSGIYLNRLKTLMNNVVMIFRNMVTRLCNDGGRVIETSKANPYLMSLMTYDFRTLNTMC
jgi:hypothetical protein